MSVGRLCVRDVDLADPDEVVQTAAARMNDRNVGTLVVLDKARRPVGIVTDRDLAMRVVAHAKDATETTVGEVMTAVPHTLFEDLPIEEAIAIMRSGPFRRMPVVAGDGTMVGLLSIDDVLDLLAGEFAQVGELLRREGPRSLAHS